MEQNRAIFGLKDELARSAPDVWEQIQSRVTMAVAKNLLRELEGIPSPQGRLFGEIVHVAVGQCFMKRGA